MAEPIQEDGHFKTKWLANLANHTLICFHSKKGAEDAGWQVAGDGELTLTRVDRNIDISRKGGVFEASGSTSVTCEGFPQMLKAVTTPTGRRWFKMKNARRLPT